VNLKCIFLINTYQLTQKKSWPRPLYSASLLRKDVMPTLTNTYLLTQIQVCHAHFIAQAAHKLKKIINLNADISENIKDSELEISDLDSVALHGRCCYAYFSTPTLTPTNFKKS